MANIKSQKKRIRQDAKKNFRNKSKPIVLVTGCVAQAEGEILLKNEKYIDAVIGPQSYHHLNKIIKKIESRAQKINSTNFFSILYIYLIESSIISTLVLFKRICAFLYL